MVEELPVQGSARRQSAAGTKASKQTPSSAREIASISQCRWEGSAAANEHGQRAAFRKLSHFCKPKTWTAPSGLYVRPGSFRVCVLQCRSVLVNREVSVDTVSRPPDCVTSSLHVDQIRNQPNREPPFMLASAENCSQQSTRVLRTTQPRSCQ